MSFTASFLSVMFLLSVIVTVFSICCVDSPTRAIGQTQMSCWALRNLRRQRRSGAGSSGKAGSSRKGEAPGQECALRKAGQVACASPHGCLTTEGFQGLVEFGAPASAAVLRETRVAAEGDGVQRRSQGWREAGPTSRRTQVRLALGGVCSWPWACPCLRGIRLGEEGRLEASQVPREQELVEGTGVPTV